MIQLLEPNIFPSVLWMQQALQSEIINFNRFEKYERQTYRNRYQRYAAQGVATLSIPVVNESTKHSFFDAKISFQEKWHINHWRTIVSAYKNAPYFEYFESDLSHFYKGEIENLWQLINETNAWIFKILQIPYQTELIEVTEEITPLDLNKSAQFKPYYQVFNDRHGFQKNLSVLDLIFHCGNDSVDFLK